MLLEPLDYLVVLEPYERAAAVVGDGALIDLLVDPGRRHGESAGQRLHRELPRGLARVRAHSAGGVHVPRTRWSLNHATSSL